MFWRPSGQNGKGYPKILWGTPQEYWIPLGEYCSPPTPSQASNHPVIHVEMFSIFCTLAQHVSRYLRTCWLLTMTNHPKQRRSVWGTLSSLVSANIMNIFVQFPNYSLSNCIICSPPPPHPRKKRKLVPTVPLILCLRWALQ